MQKNKAFFDLFHQVREDFVIWLVFIVLIPVVLLSNLITVTHQHFSVQSLGLLQGTFEMPQIMLPYYDGVDVIEYGGKFYWHLGLLPAILLLPISVVAGVVGFFPYQSYLNVFVFVIVTIFAAKIAKFTLKSNVNESMWCALLYCFGTVAILPTLVPFSWYFSQYVSMVFLLIALYFQLRGSQILLKNILLGLTLLVRVQMLPALLVFPFFYWISGGSNRLKNLAYFSISVGIALLLVSSYNFVRFGSFFDFGHSYANMPLYNKVVEQTGVFNISYLSRNLYEYFLRGPMFIEVEIGGIGVFPYLKPDVMGLSVFIITPLLLLIFTNVRWTLVNKLIGLIGIMPSLGMYLIYVSTGSGTFGPRYLLDVLPYIYFLLLQSFRFEKRLSVNIKTVILLSALFNVYLIIVWRS